MKQRLLVDDLLADNRTYIMGILNVTPDSFSDGGKYNRLTAAIDHTAQMIAEGADIIDIGGESTRPGFKQVSLEEELERVVPILEELTARFDVPFSVDTYKAGVAEAAIQAGADIINDIWGAKADPQMAKVAAETGAPIILMHNRHDLDYTDLMADLLQDLQASIDLVSQAGAEHRQIILDPGIGFAKTHQHNLAVMRQLEQVVSLGYPVLLGTSRKSMIGQTLNLPPEERLEGTLATVCLGITKGCQIVRVHDVKEVARAAKMMDAMLAEEEAIGG